MAETTPDEGLSSPANKLVTWSPGHLVTWSSAEPIGLLAGSGRFPIVFAEKARSLGIPVVCVGLRNEAAAELANLVQRFYWSGVAQLGKMIRCFRREGVERAVMAGGGLEEHTNYMPW